MVHVYSQICGMCDRYFSMIYTYTVYIYICIYIYVCISHTFMYSTCSVMCGCLVYTADVYDIHTCIHTYIHACMHSCIYKYIRMHSCIYKGIVYIARGVDIHLSIMYVYVSIPPKSWRYVTRNLGDVFSRQMCQSSTVASVTHPLFAPKGPKEEVGS